jgi:hypothetical protein
MTQPPGGRSPRPLPPLALGVSGKTLVIAWAVEVACVSIGVLMALIVGFEAGGVWAGIMAGAPFIAAAVVEFARIPLARSYFTVRGAIWKALTLVAILLAGALTAENLIFGFERAFTVRIEDVRKKSQVADEKNAEANRLDGEVKQVAAQREATQGRINQLIKQEQAAQSTEAAGAERNRTASEEAFRAAKAHLETVERERTEMLARHKNETAIAAAVCRATPDHCAIGVTQRRQQQDLVGADKKINEARQQLQRISDADRHERSQLHDQLTADLQGLQKSEEQLNARLIELNTQVTGTQAQLAEAIRVANDADATAAASRRGSQMHRLAKFFFSAEDNAAAMRTLAWFSIVAAVVLSTTGSILAATHFRTLTQPMTEQPNRLARAIRGWIARQRRKHSVVKKVEVVREVEVPVDRVVVREVEVVKPEIVLVPVPLEATEAARRHIMERAAHAGAAAQ